MIIDYRYDVYYDRFFDWLSLSFGLEVSYIYIYRENECIVLPCDHIFFLFFFIVFFFFWIFLFFFFLFVLFNIEYPMIRFDTLYTTPDNDTYGHTYKWYTRYIWKFIRYISLKENDADQELSYAAWLYRDRLIYFFFFFDLSFFGFFRFVRLLFSVFSLSLSVCFLSFYFSLEIVRSLEIDVVARWHRSVTWLMKYILLL